MTATNMCSNFGGKWDSYPPPPPPPPLPAEGTTCVYKTTRKTFQSMLLINKLGKERVIIIVHVQCAVSPAVHRAGR